MRWYLRFFKNKNSEMWEQWIPLWHIATVGLLVLAVFLMVINEELSSYNRVQWGIVIVGFMAWYSFSIIYPPKVWRSHPFKLALYLFTGWGIWGVLTYGSVVYFTLLSALFPQLFLYVEFRKAIIGAVILNSFVLFLLSQKYPEMVNVWLLVILMTSSGAIILGYFINDIINQSHKRRQLIDDLQETRAQLALAERFAGIAQERERLAADLHDTLVQSLISVVTHLEAAETTGDLDNPHLKTAKQAARDSLHDARQVIWNLQIPANDMQAFRTMLQDECHKWSERTGLHIAFTEAGQMQVLSDERQHATLRVLQEALSNISRHAQATEVYVTLKFSSDAIQLIIADDGIGFDTNVIHDGNGLKNMRRRVESLTGTFKINSQCGEGTTILTAFSIISGEQAHDNPFSVD
ncbi:MAG: sensor histidine kinase [Chloroflexota bacterium]